MRIFRFLAGILIIGELINAILLMIPAVIGAAIYLFIVIVGWSRALGIDVAALYPHMMNEVSLGTALAFHASLMGAIMALGAFFYTAIEVVQEHIGIRLMLFGLWVDKRARYPRQLGLPLQWLGGVLLIGGAVLAAWPYIDLASFLSVLSWWPFNDLFVTKPGVTAA